MTSSITDWISPRRTQIYLGVRITVACLAAFALARLLNLAQGYWAVLTAVIVMQASVGGALKASFDRFFGSLGGAALGVLVSILVPRTDPFMLGLALALAVAPLALLAAFKPTYRVAPVTAIILLLAPTNAATGPLATAYERMLEVGLGSIVALLVALFVLPARAHGVLAEATGQTLRLMAELAEKLLCQDDDSVGALAIHDRIRSCIARAEVAADEAARERANLLSVAVDPDPLVRTLRRLRHDFAMIGRTTATPGLGAAQAQLAEPLSQAGEAVETFLVACSTAVAQRRPAPAIAQVEAALADYDAALVALRRSGLIRDLPDDAIGRLFGLAFGLGQLRLNLTDLVDRITEMANA